jgi:hypothetical protein
MGVPAIALMGAGTMLGLAKGISSKIAADKARDYAKKVESTKNMWGTFTGQEGNTGNIPQAGTWLDPLLTAGKGAVMGGAVAQMGNQAGLWGSKPVVAPNALGISENTFGKLEAPIGSGVAMNTPSMSPYANLENIYGGGVGVNMANPSTMNYGMYGSNPWLLSGGR